MASTARFVCDFRAHGQRIILGLASDLSAPPGRFVACVYAAVNAADRRPGRRATLLTADIAFASMLAVPSEGGTGSAEVPAARNSFLLPRRLIHREPIPPRSLIPAAPAPLPPGNPAPPTALPPSERSSTRTRRRTAAASDTAPPPVDYCCFQAREGSSTIRPASYTSPAANPTAMTTYGRRYGPCSCLWACPNGTCSVRTRPRPRAEPAGTPL